MIVQDLFELKKVRTFDVFYSGGYFAINSAGDILFTTCGSVIKALNVQDGSERFVIGNVDDESRVSAFILSEDNLEIIVAYSNDVIKQFNIVGDKATLLHQFRGTHVAPVQILKQFHSSNLLATGGADYSVKVWHLEKRQCTHSFRGKSVVTALCFIDNGKKLIVGYSEGLVLMFNLEEVTRENGHLQLNIHTSRITAIVPITSSSNSSFGLAVFSCDQTASILNAKTLERLNTLTFTETVEGAVFLGGNDLEVLTVGDQGTIRIWSLKSATKIKESEISRSSLDNVVYCKNSKTIVCSTAERDLFFVDFKTLRTSKQFSGFNDEIYDSCFISERSNCLAVASNTPDLRIYNLSSYCCHLVQGHTESILSVDSPDWDDYLLATSSKDNSIGVWRIPAGFDLEKIHQKSDDHRSFVQRLAIGTGHTNSVTSVKFSHSKSAQFLVSVSADSTLKIWSLSGLKDCDEPEKLTCAQTFVAHSKDINTVDVSSNDKLCVTASMDHTAKLWHIDPKTLVLGIAGTLSVHKRGVWSAKFSNTHQIVATCSGDCTIKIFSLIDKSCVQTLEGHSFAVLSIHFVENSNRLLSADGGGLLKVWNLNDGVCEKTIEAHSDKIWSINTIPPSQKKSNRDSDLMEDDELKCNEKRRYVTAGSDSELIIWDDISAEMKTERIKAEAKRLTDVQSLQNYVQQEKYVDALLLTIDLAQPHQCLTIIRKMLEREKTDETGDQELKTAIQLMSSLQVSILLDFASQWNTNTRHCLISQTLLNHILRCISPKKFLNLPNVENLVRSFLPYSNRHYDRLYNLRTNVSHLNYVFANMRLT